MIAESKNVNKFTIFRGGVDFSYNSVAQTHNIHYTAYLYLVRRTGL